MFAFAVLYETEDGKMFKLFKDHIDARSFANNIACMGHEAKVFDYDMSTNEYIEFYTV